MDAWKKIEEIREIRGRLKKIGMNGVALEQLSDKVTTTVEEVVEESTELMIVSYRGEDGRRNGLTNALRADMRRLFGQIERGLTVEFRAEPKESDEDGHSKEALQRLADLSKKIQFPQITDEPLLLTSGEVLEGPIEGIRVARKISAHKTTSKKQAQGKHDGS